MVEDRIHALIFGVIIVGIWKRARSMEAGKRRQITTTAAAVLSVFLVVTLIAGLAASANPKPGLRCEIDTTVLSEKDSKGLPSITMQVTVINGGDAPSIAHNWKLGVRLLSGREISTQAVLVDQTNVFQSHVGAPDIVVSPRRNLPLQLMETPIQAGAARVGYAYFHFADVTYEDLNREGVELTISFSDREGVVISNKTKVDPKRKMY
jgi:hypothetical protein